MLKPSGPNRTFILNNEVDFLLNFKQICKLKSTVLFYAFPALTLHPGSGQSRLPGQGHGHLWVRKAYCRPWRTPWTKVNSPDVGQKLQQKSGGKTDAVKRAWRRKHETCSWGRKRFRWTDGARFGEVSQWERREERRSSDEQVQRGHRLCAYSTRCMCGRWEHTGTVCKWRSVWELFIQGLSVCVLPLTPVRVHWSSLVLHFLGLFPCIVSSPQSLISNLNTMPCLLCFPIRLNYNYKRSHKAEY